MSNPIAEEIKREFRNGSLVMRLIFINIGVFLAINIVGIFLYLAKSNYYDQNISVIINWLSVPADLGQIIIKPWTIFTYMFVHVDIMHILFNMLVLYFSGKIFLLYLSEKQLLNTYILGGLSGAVLFILFYNIFPIFSEVISLSICFGASASVMAVMIAIATFAPEFSVNLILFGPVKLKYIALIYVVVDIISIKSGNPGGHIAHLGGALWGYFYIHRYKKGNDISFNFRKIWTSIGKYLSRKSEIKVAYRKKTDSQFNAEKIQRQQKIDTILDKISKSGYESLSREEKDFLFKASNHKI